MTEQPRRRSADRALKAKHRAMWALGDYPAVATEIIPDLGAVLVEACGVGTRRPGARRRGRVAATPRSPPRWPARASSPAT